MRHLTPFGSIDWFLLLVSLSLSILKVMRPINGQEAHQQSPTEVLNKIRELLDEGSRKMNLNNKFQDLVLVMGNTGAGKTTIAKFITTNELVAYKVCGNFLIKDGQGKISVNSTLQSKTIFPELFIHEASQTAFYDLPGFQDTRSSSIEIANAFFMRQIARHGRRMKFLVIINHSSLLNGESRSDLRTLLIQSTNFVKNPAKFKNGIGLIASKVKQEGSYNQIVEWISDFLTTAKNDIPTIMNNRSHQPAIDFLDAFLTKIESGGEYSHIGLFRQPTQDGPLINQPIVQEHKRRLENLVLNTLQFVPASSNDFGLSLSGDAKLMVKGLTDTVLTDLGKLMVTLWSEVWHHLKKNILFRPSSGTVAARRAMIEELFKIQKNLSDVTKAMRAELRRRKFLNMFVDFLFTLRIQNVPTVATSLESMKKYEEQLKFFAEVNEESIPAKCEAWTTSFNQISDWLNFTLTQEENWLRMQYDYSNPRTIMQDRDGAQGTWGRTEYCPEGSIVDGFSVNYVPYRGSITDGGNIAAHFFSAGISAAVYAAENLDDDFGVTGIQLLCSDPAAKTPVKTIISDYISWAKVKETHSWTRGEVPGYEWTNMDQCPHSAPAVGFQVKTQPPQGSEDDFGVINFKLICRGAHGNRPDPPISYNVAGNHQWSPEIRCPEGHAVCGLQTKTHKVDRKTDSVGLSDVRLECCPPFPNSDSEQTYCTAQAKEVTVSQIRNCYNTSIPMEIRLQSASAQSKTNTMTSSQSNGGSTITTYGIEGGAAVGILWEASLTAKFERQFGSNWVEAHGKELTNIDQLNEEREETLKIDIPPFHQGFVDQLTFSCGQTRFRTKRITVHSRPLTGLECP